MPNYHPSIQTELHINPEICSLNRLMRSSYKTPCHSKLWPCIRLLTSGEEKSLNIIQFIETNLYQTWLYALLQMPRILQLNHGLGLCVTWLTNHQEGWMHVLFQRLLYETKELFYYKSVSCSCWCFNNFFLS